MTDGKFKKPGFSELVSFMCKYHKMCFPSFQLNLSFFSAIYNADECAGAGAAFSGAEAALVAAGAFKGGAIDR